MKDIKETIQVKQNIVLDKLHEMITSGYFRPEESLSEREIAEMFGVSRTPVREAFRRLEKEGLVIYEPMKGVTIMSFSTKDITDLYRVREYLEGLMSRILTEKNNRDILTKLRENIEQSEVAAKNHDVKKQAVINGQFHQIVAEGTENAYLINMMKPLQSQLGFFRSISLSYLDRSLGTIEEHKLICDTIESGDADQAEQAARLHVQNGLKKALVYSARVGKINPLK